MDMFNIVLMFAIATWLTRSASAGILSVTKTDRGGTLLIFGKTGVRPMNGGLVGFGRLRDHGDE